jgi:type VI secretion system protein ImpF
MAELIHKERLQPSLLDRLTDDAPDQRDESREARIISSAKLRASVKRDLAWLLNTTCFEAVESLADFPNVQRSVINFGIPDLAGKPVSAIKPFEMETRFREALIHFEPRLKDSSIKITLKMSDVLMSHNSMVFSIEADLWAQPMPLRLFFRTQLDLETGTVDVSETTGVR